MTETDCTAPPSAAMSASRVSRRVVVRWGILGALLGMLVAVVITNSHGARLTVAGSNAGSVSPAGQAGAAIVAQPVSAAGLAALPLATTFTTLLGAPPDAQEQVMPSGDVLHPTVTVPVYVAPGGPAIAAAPVKEWASDTWFPVVASQPGWARVLLPTRPNGATGWIDTTDARVQSAYTPFRVVVDRATFKLTLSTQVPDSTEDRVLGSWSVGVGTPDAVTPSGRTFLLASILEEHPSFSPVIVPLGTHSDSYETYGGGPGTVGLHTWPTADVYGKPTSHGCVRVPPDALAQLSHLPTGTPVLII